MKVVCIRLNSGEEIIGRVVEPSFLLGNAPVDTSFTGVGPWDPIGLVTIEMVRGITAQPVGKDQMQIAFFPWSLGNSDGKFTINLDQSAVTIYPAESNLEQGYLQQTSKIQIASAGALTKM